MRVFTGGIATETNTFAPMPTGMAIVPRPRLLPGRARTPTR